MHNSLGKLDHIATGLGEHSEHAQFMGALSLLHLYCAILHYIACPPLSQQDFKFIAQRSHLKAS